MTGNNGKFTYIFFLWLAGLIILLHAVIPHHHHFDSNFSHQNDDSQKILYQENNTGDSPLHCYAFNDILNDQIKTVETPKVHGKNLYSTTVYELSLPVKSSEVIINVSINIVPPWQYFPAYISLRAPPFLV